MRVSGLGIIFLVLAVLVVPVVYGSGEIDALTVVSSVIYGDTFNTTTEGIMKLGDVDPTCADIDNATGFISSKIFLESLIAEKTVYLDIDNLYVTDYSGTGNRTVCVTYIDHNSTHYLNVNQAMLEHKLLEINDQENDFNPNNWTYYVKKQDIPEFPTWTAIALFMVLTTTAMILRTKNQKHMKNVSSKY